QIMTSTSRVVPSIPWTEIFKYEVNKLTKADHLMIVSEYIKKTLICVAIQVCITLCVVISESI
ncbi:unnamed protein product, partial [Schistosoma turkestanicum]